MSGTLKWKYPGLDPTGIVVYVYDYERIRRFVAELTISAMHTYAWGGEDSPFTEQRMPVREGAKQSLSGM